MMTTTRATSGSSRGKRQDVKKSRKPLRPKPSAITDEEGRWVPARSGAGIWLRDHLVVGNAATFAVGMGIVLRLDDSLVCWAKVETLGADVNTSKSSVERAVRTLREENLIRTLWIYRGPKRITNLYVLNLQGWLDDAPSFIDRVKHVRAQALEQGLVQPLPEGTRLVESED